MRSYLVNQMLRVYLEYIIRILNKDFTKLYKYDILSTKSIIFSHPIMANIAHIVATINKNRIRKYNENNSKLVNDTRMDSKSTTNQLKHAIVIPYTSVA